MGDSCLSIDPLSSQGIQTAIASGLQVAVVVNTILRQPTNARAAIAFYAAAQRERCMNHSARTARLYAERAALVDAPFWRERATHHAETNAFEPETARLALDIRLGLSHQASIEDELAIRGDMIETSDALRHPSLVRPAVFLDDIALVPLIRQMNRGKTAADIVTAWSARLPLDRCWQLLDWLWLRRIVVPVNEVGEVAARSSATDCGLEGGRMLNDIAAAKASAFTLKSDAAWARVHKLLARLQRLPGRCSAKKRLDGMDV